VGFWSDFLTHDGRPTMKLSHYYPIYERHFARFVNRSLTMVEIGVSKGGSLQLWKRYLGPFAQIVGLDINPKCKKVEEDQIAVRIGDQKDTAFLQGVIDEFGAPDIVVDDGSHIMQDVTAAFGFLYPRMPENGVYLVEDMCTAYWPECGGGLGEPASFIEFSKKLIDELNADHARGAISRTEFTATTMSIHFYDCVVVFERGRHAKIRPVKSR
jgi:hypothetical protein